MKFIKSELRAIGGVKSKIITIANGIVAPAIQGILRPHLVLVRSERYPMSGSLIAFHRLHKIKAPVIQRTSNPTTA
ncbi:hypothetical protein ES703_123355 [subsurface metagenome]